MCTNSARLMNNLECYMDDLVDCFEDFVKKSLVIISVAAGALVVMLGYVLKIVADRSQIPPAIPSPMGVQAIEHRTAATMSSPQSASSSVRTADLQVSRSSTLPQKSFDSTTMPCLNMECRRTTSTAANTGPQLNVMSFDEKVLRNIGLTSCPKNCIQGKRSVMRNYSTPRISIPNIPTCIPNHHLSIPRPCLKYITKTRNSCCSMCCADDDRR